MCLDEEDDPRPTTDPASALAARAFNALIRKLKYVPANAAGVKPLRHKAYNANYARSERGKKTIRAYEQRNRAKRAAYWQMHQALKRGTIKRAERCESCGVDGKIDAHHDDYSKPLTVTWLCRPCHKTWHKLNGKATNG